jgi:hypothetical protein
MNLLKDKNDKIKPSCLNLFIRGLLESDRYYEAISYIPEYVSSSNQLMFYTSFIKNEARKNMKKYTGWGSLKFGDGWADFPLEMEEESSGTVFYSSSEE